MPLIEVRNVVKTYGRNGTATAALRGISLLVEAGEFAAIMGPSGSGKSTLLHILGFLDRPTEGEYRFDGKTIRDYTPEELARVRNRDMGFVFQAFNLLPRTSVFENVALPLAYSTVPEAEWTDRVRSAVESVGLGHRRDHMTNQLSGGEQQRAAIARALVNQPKIVFADEPTGNLDSQSGAAIMDILGNLNRNRNHTIILITHEWDIARRAQRIIRIRDGLIAGDERL